MNIYFYFNNLLKYVPLCHFEMEEVTFMSNQWLFIARRHSETIFLYVSKSLIRF